MQNSVAMRALTEGDLPFADSLCDQAGWNQVCADWRRLMAHDLDGCFVAGCDDGDPAGTATTTTYCEDLAWIGMVLVHPDRRRRGIGTALLQHCIAHLRERKGVRCIKLDATPEGREVYIRLGFSDEWRLSRWMRTVAPGPSDPGCGEITDGGGAVELDLDSGSLALAGLMELDTVAFGVSRHRMLSMLAEQSQSASVRARSGEIVACGMIRPGRRAAYLGPVVARPNIGRSGVARIVDHLLESDPGRPVYWDIPDEHTAAVGLAKRLGFERQRSFTRMVSGVNSCPGNPQLQWGIGGPAIG